MQIHRIGGIIFNPRNFTGPAGYPQKGWKQHMADEIKTMETEGGESRIFIHAFIAEDIAPG